MKIIGMSKQKYIGQNIKGHNWEFEYYDEEMERHILYCILSDGRRIKITLDNEYGECGSGWCTASWGIMKVEEIPFSEGFDYLPYERYEIEDITPECVGKYGGYEINNSVFTISSCGDDPYYPSGGYTVKEELFYKTVRANDNRPVWIFQGSSNLGKSFLSHKISELSIYETDSSEGLPETIKADIIVLGNRNSFTIEEIKEKIFGDCKLIIVNFEESTN